MPLVKLTTVANQPDFLGCRPTDVEQPARRPYFSRIVIQLPSATEYLHVHEVLSLAFSWTDSIHFRTYFVFSLSLQNAQRYSPPLTVKRSCSSANAAYIAYVVVVCTGIGKQASRLRRSAIFEIFTIHFHYVYTQYCRDIIRRKCQRVRPVCLERMGWNRDVCRRLSLSVYLSGGASPVFLHPCLPVCRY